MRFVCFASVLGITTANGGRIAWHVPVPFFPQRPLVLCAFALKKCHFDFFLSYVIVPRNLLFEHCDKAKSLKVPG